MPDDPARREPELLTVTEAAALLRAPVATLRYWRDRPRGSGWRPVPRAVLAVAGGLSSG